MNTDSPEPSLNDARARIARAGEHIISLEAVIASVLPAKRTISVMISGGYFAGGEQTIKAPPLVAILIGETIYNLRGALDYLVYELFFLNTGKTSSKTKFLIEDSPNSWKRYLTSTDPKKIKGLWLPKLSIPQQAALERLQPFSGCKWTKTIQTLSNPDKHRRLLTILGRQNHGPGFNAGSDPVMVQFDVTQEVAFEDGSLVVETLKFLEKEVGNVIEAFEPDFK